MSRILDDLDDFDRGGCILWLAVLIFAGFVCALLFGCATTAAIAEAPEEFWITVEAILLAVLDDVIAVVDLFL